MSSSSKNSLSRHFPRLALLLAACMLLTFTPDQDGFPVGFHGYLSSHGATLTVNLSPEHGWMMFERLYLGDDGEVHFKPYNRFPVTSFLILKAASFPFASDPGAALLVMHQVMNLFLLAALWTAIRCLQHLGLSRTASTGAGLLTFSTFYLLYFGDMIFVDTPTLFGCLLALEGMALHQRQGSRRSLLLRSLIGVSFGWQVFAFLLPYTAFLALQALLQPGEKRIGTFFRSPGTQTGLAVLVLGGGMLLTNLWTEHRITGVPFSELDSLSSAGKRLGAHENWNQKHFKKLSSGTFLRDQVRRVGRATLPAVLPPWPGPSLCIAAGALALLLAGVCALKGPFPLLAWTAILSGFLWAIPLKYFVAFHEFQALYYVGIPLLLYGTCFGIMERRLPALIPWGSLAALLLFSAGTLHVTQDKVLTSGKARALTEDFRVIAGLIPPGARYAMTGTVRELANPSHGGEYYLPGRVICDPCDALYLIDHKEHRFGQTLTPNNRYSFLFLNPRMSGQTESPAYDHPLLIRKNREDGAGAH